MDRKIYVLIVIIGLMVLAFFFFSSFKQQDIKIGAVLQLTGTDSEYGASAQKGIELAVEEINSNGGVNGTPIRVIFEDGQGVPSTSISSFKKLVEFDGVKVVLTQASSVSLALSPLANDYQVVLMDVGSATPQYRSEDDFTFRTAITALQLADAEANAIADLNIKTVGILYVNDDYGQGMVAILEDVFSKRGVAVLEKDSFSNSDPDFRTPLVKINEKDPEGCVLVTRIGTAETLIRQVREVGLTSRIFTDVYGIESKDVVARLGSQADGIVYVAPKFDGNIGNAPKRFIQNYYSKYAEHPAQLSAQAYDAVMVLSIVLKNCSQNDSNCIKNALFETSFDGASGKIEFDSAGETKYRPTMLKIIKNGEFVPYGGT